MSVPLRTMGAMFGDILKVSMGLYSHYGVDYGNDEVLELSGDRAKEISSAKVRVSSRATFAHGGIVEVVCSPTQQQLEGFMTRAFQLLGEPGYNLIGRNCEHVARYVATGNWTSTQVATAGWIAFGAFLLTRDWSDDEDSAAS